MTTFRFTVPDWLRIRRPAPPARGRVDYRAYLLTPEWRARADAAKARAGWRCQGCGAGDVPLEAHHTASGYEHLGNERPEDLLVYCRECHQAISNVQRARKARRRG